MVLWHCHFDVEKVNIRVEEEPWYEKTMFLVLDEGDATTPTERQLKQRQKDMKEEQAGGQEDVSARRSSRARKHVEDSNFVFVFLY